MKPVMTSLLCNNHSAGEMVEFYSSLAPDISIIYTTYYPENSGDKSGKVLAVHFHMFGQEFVAINGGPSVDYTMAVSLMIRCDTQEEIDRFWNKLSEGGKPLQCGWITDRFGLTWQVTPERLNFMLRDPNKAKAAAAMEAMCNMVKLDLPALEKAFKAA